jgi:ribonuclease BN (tRNA processing enzyme)
MASAVLLGSGGWIPTDSRATCSALVRSGDHALVIDAGTGIRRLVENPELLDGVERMDVVLTHFHLDHVVGLAYFPALPLPFPPTIHGPAQWLYGLRSEDVLGRLVGHPLFALELGELTSGVREIDPAGLALGPFRVTARPQEQHDDTTLALRVDDLLTYCTDTAADDGNVEFARASRTLVHEAWYTETAPTAQATHSSAAQAADIARRAGVERLVLIHVPPVGGHEAELLAEARSVFEPSELGTDLLALA